MADQQYKRNVAYKYRIKSLLIGKPVSDGDRFSFLELGDKKIVRVNVVGNIVDKFEGQSQNNTPYLTFTVDDGSGQIKLKVFGEDAAKFQGFSQGDTIVVIGVLRFWNNEIYITPEIMREANPRYLLLRKLETEKLNGSLGEQASMPATSSSPPASRNMAVKDKILDLVKGSEDQGGIDTEDLIKNLRDFPPEIINQEIQKLLEEGIAFEPRPGKIRWLG